MSLFASRDPQARRWLAQALAVLLSLPPAVVAQQPSGPPAKPLVPLPTVRSLKVAPLAGSNEMNDLERGVMAPLVVQVLDQNDNPVEGAEVVFRFPITGPSAVFPDQKDTQTVKTNFSGQAAAVGWTANRQVGSFHVHVTASHGSEIGEATILMTNVTRVADQGQQKRRGWWSSKWAKVAIIAGAAAAVTVVVLATRSGSGSSASTPTITARPGSPTIGGPP
jgi:hypothetical protein